MKRTGGNIYRSWGKNTKRESRPLMAAASHTRVHGRTLLAEDMAEECKQCTKLAIHTFTNQMIPLGLLFRLRSLSNMQTNAIDAPKVLGAA